MPKLTQGDIFDAAKHSQLTVVFGRIGFNQMAFHWRRFSALSSELLSITDPFIEKPRQPIAWSDDRWLWMIPVGEEHGLTDNELEEALDEAVAWAVKSGVESIATNGAADTIQSGNSRNESAAWLIAYARATEESHRLTIELVSLSEVYLSRRLMLA
jgi:hypothetical protein